MTTASTPDDSTVPPRPDDQEVSSQPEPHEPGRPGAAAGHIDFSQRKPVAARPRFRAYLTILLIVACIGTYLASRLWPAVESTLIFSPWLGLDQPYRFIGSAFLHADFWHLAFNMFALWLVGNALEPAIGPWRFGAIYILSAFAGNAAVALLADQSGSSWTTYVVGASGAVFGLFGALFVMLRRIDANSGPLFAVIGINLILGFVIKGISWQSHIGGLAAGALLMGLYILRYKPPFKYRTPWVDAISTVLVTLLIIGVAAIAYA